MTTPIAFLNGKFIPGKELSMPVTDTGFVMGVTVTEQMRTFNGKLFRLEEHLQRFQSSLQYVGLTLPIEFGELADAAVRLAEHNHALLDSGDDLGLCLFATPGTYAAMASTGTSGPMVALHTYPIAFEKFAKTYTSGQRLTTSSIRQIPAEILPRELKCRSRMHYYLADHEAAHKEPGSRALLLDGDGCVLETTTANVLIYREGDGLVSPPPERILPGISVAATLEIASQLGIPHEFREVTSEDFSQASEAYLTSTSVCILPVVTLDGRAIGSGQPGPMYQRLLAGWQELTGVDIVEQANRFQSR